MKHVRLPFYFIVGGLLLAGLLTAWLRHKEMQIPFQPDVSRSVWLVEARIDFNASGEAALVSFDLPDNPPGFQVFAEQAASPGYGFSIIESSNRRRGEWSRASASDQQTLYYKAQFVRVDDIPPIQDTEVPEVESVFWGEPEATAVSELLEQAEARASSPQSLTRELIKSLSSPSRSQNAELLRAEAGSDAELLVRLLNEAGVPARLAMGLYLEDARRRQELTRLIQVWEGEQWLTFNPVTAEEGVPENLLLWHRGGEAFLDVTGGSQSQVSFSMIRQTVPALELARAQFSDSSFALLGVYRLSIEEQSMFKLLFLLPLGALVVVVMRVLVGIRTAGTFMPILIALAFLQTTLLPGLISFISIVGLGLLLRGYLSNLNLLLVPRIAALVVLVVLLISFLSLAGYHLGLNTGMTITFFPMIIIAWTIERMSILWEEEGAREVLVQGGGSLFVAMLAYLLMQLSLTRHLSFNFPELNLVTLALILMLGQYTGYKLTELHRFHAMMDIKDDQGGNR